MLFNTNDSTDIPGINMVWLDSMNDHKAWEGNIEDVITTSIRDARN
jgi:hypothetical protein